jgi:hypothetical protein
MSPGGFVSVATGLVGLVGVLGAGVVLVWGLVVVDEPLGVGGWLWAVPVGLPPLQPAENAATATRPTSRDAVFIWFSRGLARSCGHGTGIEDDYSLDARENRVSARAVAG